jgi:selenide,water dikinase
MNGVQIPVVKSLVLVGGGHAHVHVLKRFGMRPMPGVRITLVTRDVDTPYSGMIPGFAAGHYSYEECHIDLYRLASFAGARLIHDRAVGIDRDAGRVRLADSAPVAYDVLSLDIGAEPRQDVPGASTFAVAVKPVSTFAERYRALLDRARGHQGPLRVVVVGGGAGGTEFALALRHRLDTLGREAPNGLEPQITLVSRNGALANHTAGARRLAERALQARNIHFVANREVASVDVDAVILGGGERIAADEIIWVTQAAAAPWLADTGLALDEGGFVKVKPTLQTETDPVIFAAGDVAAVVEHPRPKAGVFAVRQGPPLADNLRFALGGLRPLPFRPQRRYLALIGTGDGRAIATRGSWAAEGRWAWKLKDWIDRRWMRGYCDLSATMKSDGGAPVVVADATLRNALAEASMRCGGCGAKVGASVLSRALSRLERSTGEGVMIGLDAPDDAAVLLPPPGQALVQSVDFFRALLDDPYVLGRIAANHALGDLYAMGATPHSALAVATVPYAAERIVEDDLLRLLAGAQRTLGEAGVTLIGGHSAEAAELALGFSVNGFVDPGKVLRKGGLRVGDALVLTKPIGTGVLFAAAMRRKARAAWLETATASMVLSNRAAVAILHAHRVRACTDVTGFGLVGHLAEMMKASGVSATLALPSVPALDGAQQMFAEGQQSSLHPDNLRARHVIANLVEVANDPRLPVLFDPQTAGGLVAGIPDADASACVAELRKAGYADAAIIGHVTAMDGMESLVTVHT